MNLLSIFVTGLFAGGLTCLAVQGGLLASAVASQEGENHTLPAMAFLTARLVAYTILGVILGALGSTLQLSFAVQIVLQILVAIFMAGTAFNLLNVHPIFRYFIIQPPRTLTKLIKNQSKSRAVFGPAILGAMTILIPCGATQAMMAYTLTTGSATLGGLTMFVFMLGTTPLFLGLGYLTKKLSHGSGGLVFNRLAATAILVIVVYNLSGTAALAGVSLPSIKTDATSNTPVTQAEIFFHPQGYSTTPDTITVRGGAGVSLDLINRGAGGCVQAFTIPSLGIQKIVRPGGVERISFTVPDKPGILPFMCSMGMYRGQIIVI